MSEYYTYSAKPKQRRSVPSILFYYPLKIYFNFTNEIMCRHFLYPHFTFGKSLLYPSHFPIKIQTGTHLTTSEKAWPTKIWAFEFSTYFKFEHYWQNVRVSCPGSSFSPCFHISQFLPFAVRLPQISLHWDCSAQTHKRYHGIHRLWKNYNSDCSRHVSCLRHSRPYHASQLQHTFGLSGYVISWIRSYLTNRTSFVKMTRHPHPTQQYAQVYPRALSLAHFSLFFSYHPSPVS